jgi:3-oxoacyl-[acyl-carrier protein] reductase
MFDLTGKNALVTGATGGIGGAIARKLHAQGAVVAISGRQVDKLEALAAELKERVFVVPCDLANKEQVAGLIDAATKVLGRVDILVNNAGLTKDNLFMVMKDEQWDDVIAVNLTSTFMLMRAASRAMVRAKTGYGRIINISSVSGIIGNPRHHRQLHRPGLHLDADDGSAERKADGDDQRTDPGGQIRHARRHCGRRVVSRQQ